MKTEENESLRESTAIVLLISFHDFSDCYDQSKKYIWWFSDLNDVEKTTLLLSLGEGLFQSFALRHDRWLD